MGVLGRRYRVSKLKMTKYFEDLEDQNKMFGHPVKKKGLFSILGSKKLLY